MSPRSTPPTFDSTASESAKSESATSESTTSTPSGTPAPPLRARPLSAAYRTPEVARDVSQGTVHDPGQVQDGASVLHSFRRGLKQFLAIPLAMCLLAIALAAALSFLDHNPPPALKGLRGWLESTMFTSSEDTVAAITTLMAGLFGLSTITFSMLLIALQQSSSSTGVQVVDGFVGRKRNQAVLGTLLGVTIFVTMTRVLGGDAQVNPVFGGMVALALTLVCVFVLALLFFMVTNQSRPKFIVDDLRARILSSRRSMGDDLQRLRRQTLHPDAPFHTVLARGHGYLQGVDFARLDTLVSAHPGGEIELTCELGDYRVDGDPVARVRGARDVSDDAVLAALTFDSQRTMKVDPTAGLVNLGAIAWRTGSGVQGNFETATSAVNALADILVHWLADRRDLLGKPSWNVVYPDTALFQLLDTLEQQLLAVSRSQQPSTTAHLLSVFARAVPRMDGEVLDRTGTILRRGLGWLDPARLTLATQLPLQALERELRTQGQTATADRVRDILDKAEKAA